MEQVSKEPSAPMEKDMTPVSDPTDLRVDPIQQYTRYNVMEDVYHQLNDYYTTAGDLKNTGLDTLPDGYYEFYNVCTSQPVLWTQIKNGQRHGILMYWENRVLRIIARFDHSVSVYGKLYDKQGRLGYEGYMNAMYQMRKGKLTKYSYPHNNQIESIYTGEFLSGRMHGFGKLHYYTSLGVKRTYEGNFAAGQFHGQGKLYNSSNKVIEDGLYHYGSYQGQDVNGPKTCIIC